MYPGCTTNYGNTYNKKWLKLLVKGKVNKKYTLVEFSTTWCMPCKTLEKQVLNNDSVKTFLNDNANILSVDAEKGMGLALAMKYSITAYPTLLVFNPEGILVCEKIGIDGIGDPGVFTDYFSEVFRGNNKLPAKGLSHDLNLSYPDFYTQYFLHKKQPDSSTIINYFKKQINMFSEVNWAVMRVFGDNDSIQNLIARNAGKYIDLYGCMVNRSITKAIQHSAIGDYERKDSIQFKKDVEAILKLRTDLSAKQLAKKRCIYTLDFWARTGYWNNFLSCWKEYRSIYGADLDVPGAVQLIDEYCEKQEIRDLAEYLLQQRITRNPHDWQSIVWLANLLQREDLQPADADRHLVIHADWPGGNKPRAESLYQQALKEMAGHEDTISVIVYDRVQSALFIPNENGWWNAMNFFKKYLPNDYKKFYRFHTIGYYSIQKKWALVIKYVNEYSKQLGGFEKIHKINAYLFARYADDISRASRDANQIKTALSWINSVIRNNATDPDLSYFEEVKKSLQNKSDSLSEMH